MILDLCEYPDNAEYQTDICLVGSGAAGLAIAREFFGSSFQVVIAEGGGNDFEGETQSLYKCVVDGHSFESSYSGRFRIFGGSTTKWGGQSLPLMPIDFVKREWVAHSGWPLSYEDLAPYYRRANQFLLVDTYDYESDLFHRLKTTPVEFESSSLRYHFSKWSPMPNLREIYRREIQQSQNILLLFHANLCEIRLTEDLQAVCSMTFRTLQGKQCVIRARIFVLCCGGLENARLLLAANDQIPCGIGNQKDLVGRFLLEHPVVTLGFLSPADDRQIQEKFNQFYCAGRKYSVRFSLSEEYQRENQVLNASGAIIFDLDEDHPLSQLKLIGRCVKSKTFDGKTVKALAVCLLHPQAMIEPLFNYFVKKRAFYPRARTKIGAMFEQEPNPDSRVRLSDEKDALGMPRLLIQWKFTEQSRNTLIHFSHLVEKEFERLALGKVIFESWIKNGFQDWEEHLSAQSHHMGATRMGTTDREGVVDKDCRVYGLDNLFIGGSSVFPTGGHSNPTLTLIALSIRIADHIRRIR